MPIDLLLHLLRFALPVTLPLALAGGFAWHPDCTPAVNSVAGTFQVCSNFWCSVNPADAAGIGLTMRGIGIGAVVGVIVALIAVYVRGVPKEQVGME